MFQKYYAKYIIYNKIIKNYIHTKLILSLHAKIYKNMAQETTPQEEPKAMLIIPMQQWLNLVANVEALAARNTENENEKMLSVDDVMKVLGVGRPTVYRYINERGLQAHKVGGKRMFRKGDVDKFIKEKANV